jgi:hypothetical protein
LDLRTIFPKASIEQLEQLLSHLHANVASLYNNLGQSKKAEEIRRRDEVLLVG